MYEINKAFNPPISRVEHMNSNVDGVRRRYVPTMESEVVTLNGWHILLLFIIAVAVYRHYYASEKK